MQPGLSVPSSRYPGLAVWRGSESETFTNATRTMDAIARGLGAAPRLYGLRDDANTPGVYFMTVRV